MAEDSEVPARKRFVLGGTIPYELQFRLRDYYEDTRPAVDAFFQELLAGPFDQPHPSMQIRQLQATFGYEVEPPQYGRWGGPNGHGRNLVPKALDFTEKMRIQHDPNLLIQLDHLDLFHNWIMSYPSAMRGDRVTVNEVIERYFMLYYQQNDPIPIPYGSAGFREVFLRTRRALHYPIYKVFCQAFYGFEIGRFILEPERTPLHPRIVLHIPRILHDPMYLLFRLVRESDIPALPTYKSSVEKLYVVRPIPQFEAEFGDELGVLVKFRSKDPLHAYTTANLE